jgi:hypothetical protein
VQQRREVEGRTLSVLVRCGCSRRSYRSCVHACNIIVLAVKTAIVVITKASVGTSCDFIKLGHQSSANSFKHSTLCNLIVI